MKNKNLIYLVLAAGAGYYFYNRSKKNKLQIPNNVANDSLDKTEDQKPKTFLQKAARLVQKAANTKEGKKLIAKGKDAIAKKLKLKKMGADYLYL